MVIITNDYMAAADQDKSREAAEIELEDAKSAHISARAQRRWGLARQAVVEQEEPAPKAPRERQAPVQGGTPAGAISAMSILYMKHIKANTVLKRQVPGKRVARGARWFELQTDDVKLPGEHMLEVLLQLSRPRPDVTKSAEAVQAVMDTVSIVPVQGESRPLPCGAVCVSSRR
jgi:hypothetical protein